MPSKKSDDHKLADRANELYWRSKQSVNQIAEALDLSKSGLYALIQPLPTGSDCPECGQALVFTNRTTEHKAIASCPECEYPASAPAPGATPKASKRRSPRRTTPSKQPDGKPERELAIGVDGGGARQTNGLGGLRSNRVLWGSVLLGLAAGLYVTRRSR